MAEVPEPLRAAGFRLEPGGSTMAAVAAPGVSFGPALAALAASRLPVQDLETIRMRLEDVFVSLVRGNGGSRGKGAAA
jgi:hypothetical protein